MKWLQIIKEAKEFEENCEMRDIGWGEWLYNTCVRFPFYIVRAKLCGKLWKHDYVEIDWHYDGYVCVECTRCGHTESGWW